MRVRQGLLLLFVVFVGIQFGGGLYEKLAIVPLWADAPTDQVRAAMDSSGMYRAGRYFWPFVSPVVVILAVVNLVLALRSRVPGRPWWIAAGATMTLYAVVSYGYFVPEMLHFQHHGSAWTDDQVQDFVATWTGLNYGRMVLGAAGWACALGALRQAGTWHEPDLAHGDHRARSASR